MTEHNLTSAPIIGPILQNTTWQTFICWRKKICVIFHPSVHLHPCSLFTFVLPVLLHFRYYCIAMTQAIQNKALDITTLLSFLFFDYFFPPFFPSHEPLCIPTKLQCDLVHSREPLRWPATFTERRQNQGKLPLLNIRARQKKKQSKKKVQSIPMRRCRHSKCTVHRIKSAFMSCLRNRLLTA